MLMMGLTTQTPFTLLIAKTKITGMMSSAVSLMPEISGLVILLTALLSLTGMRPSAVHQAISLMASLGLNVRNLKESFLIALTQLSSKAPFKLTIMLNAVTIIASRKKMLTGHGVQLFAHRRLSKMR